MENIKDHKDGDEIFVNGKLHRICGLSLVPYEQGKLGGILKPGYELKKGDVVYLECTVEIPTEMNGSNGQIATEIGILEFEPMDIFETNIPPQPTFKLMTAREVSEVPDVNGKYLAFRIRDVSNGTSPVYPIRVFPDRWLHQDQECLLIDGVELP